MKFKGILIICVFSLLVAGQTVAAEKKGLDHYFKKPQYASFQLSPNGTELAGLVPINGPHEHRHPRHENQGAARCNQ